MYLLSLFRKKWFNQNLFNILNLVTFTEITANLINSMTLFCDSFFYNLIFYLLTFIVLVGSVITIFMV